MCVARVLEYIEEHREEMIRFLRRLERIDTPNSPGLNYDVICDVIVDKLVDLDCEVFIHEAPERYMEFSGAKFMGLEGLRVKSSHCTSGGIKSGLMLYLAPLKYNINDSEKMC